MVRPSFIRPPQRPKMYTKEYKQWRGVYFTNDESLLNESHSPAMQNIVRNTNGDWEKRLGWRTLHTFGSKINGIHRIIKHDGIEQRLVHTGSYILGWTDLDHSSLSPVEMNNAPSTSFVHNESLYILDGANYWEAYIGDPAWTFQDATTNAFIPTTTIGRLPTGGGTAFEAVNLLQPKRINSFIGDGGTKAEVSMQVALGAAASGNLTITLNGAAVTVAVLIGDTPLAVAQKIRATAFANWVTGGTDYTVTFTASAIGLRSGTYSVAVAATGVLAQIFATNTGTNAATVYKLDCTGLDAAAVTATVNGAAKVETTDFTVNRTTGEVTFLVAPPSPTVAGVDNVTITPSKTVTGYADMIKKCTICTTFGIGNNVRTFVTGNPDYPNRDWYSGLDDPTYFPDTSYTDIGSDASKIMGYHKLGNSLMIIKEDNDQDATIFERTAEMVDGTLTFSLKQGVTGVGAYAKGSFSNLRDDPLFVSKQGVEAIGTNYMDTLKLAQNRSLFVNARLTKEANLQNAISVIWKGYYILCVNSHCYVADSVMKTRKYTKDNESIMYEFTYWTNIPATVFFELNDALYFGTADGKLCKFNTDRLDADGNPAMNAYSDDGVAIDASLATILDDDGDFMRYKTVPINGSGVLIKPFTTSSIAVTAVDETGDTLTVNSTETGIMDFSNMDFDNFSFQTSSSPVSLPFSTMINNYQRLRYIVRNNVVDEGFGIAGIIKRFFYGGYVR